MLAVKQKPFLFEDDPFLSERAADKGIIKELLKELYGRNQMSNIVQDAEGNLLIVHQFEHATVEEAKEIVVKLKKELAVAEAWITAQETSVDGEVNNDQNDTPAPATGESSQPEATDTPAASEPEAAAETPPAPAEADPAPADPVASAENPNTDPSSNDAEPSDVTPPATDPAGNPITLQ